MASIANDQCVDEKSSKKKQAIDDSLVKQVQVNGIINISLCVDNIK